MQVLRCYTLCATTPETVNILIETVGAITVDLFMAINKTCVQTPSLPSSPPSSITAPTKIPTQADDLRAAHC